MPPLAEIVAYRADWDMVKHAGHVTMTIKVSGGTEGYISRSFSVRNLSELHAIVTLLREEKPAHFSVSSIMIGATDLGEPVGEGEA